MNTNVFLRSLVFLFTFGALVACDSDNNSSSQPAPEEPIAEPPAPELGSIVDVARDAGSFTTLLTALEAAGLDATLADEDSDFTVFAPTDEAFEALPEGTLDTLLADTDLLTDVLLYHVVGGAAVDSIDATALYGEMVTMLNEATVTIDVRDGELYINDSKVIIKDIPATNGIIHVIDMVLIPESEEPAEPAGTIVDIALADPQFSTLVTALEAADLVSTLADETAVFTVFAPTDDAFALLGTDTINSLLADVPTLTNILTYHVIGDQAVDAATAISLDGSDVEMLNGDTVSVSVQDDVLYINDSAVIAADVVATNGVIHVIDAVLTPPES